MTCMNDMEVEEYDFDDLDNDFPCTADGCRLNAIGIELGLEDCALTDDEKDCFCL